MLEHFIATFSVDGGVNFDEPLKISINFLSYIWKFYHLKPIGRGFFGFFVFFFGFSIT